ncbi:MAG: hypothetical protein SFZ03_02965 [Candidatus Melainabacteria bacterium]|nr:hypothetical protein [Candidatus Melainabacteria bacterium]
MFTANVVRSQSFYGAPRFGAATLVYHPENTFFERPAQVTFTLNTLAPDGMVQYQEGGSYSKPIVDPRNDAIAWQTHRFREEVHSGRERLCEAIAPILESLQWSRNEGYQAAADFPKKVLGYLLKNQDRLMALIEQKRVPLKLEPLGKPKDDDWEVSVTVPIPMPWRLPKKASVDAASADRSAFNALESNAPEQTYTLDDLLE